MTDYTLIVGLLDADVNYKHTDIFIKHLYNYHNSGGFKKMILNDVILILTYIFAMSFINFIVTCIDIDGIITNTGETSISKYIHLNRYWDMGVFMIISVVLFTIFIIMKIMSLINDVITYSPIKKYYNHELGISDQDIRHTNFDNIINMYYDKENLTAVNRVYTVVNKLMKIDNIMISLFDNNKLPFKCINKIIEHTIKYCILSPLLDEKNDIVQNTAENMNTYIKQCKTKLGFIMFFSVILLPFTFMFNIMYTIIDYGEVYYNTPKLIFARKWDISYKWKFKFYNELPEMFKNRMKKCNEHIINYFNTRENVVLEAISKLLIFVLSTFLIFLVVITLINNNNFSNEGFFGFQSVFWYITIIITLIAILKGINATPTNEDSASKHLVNLNEHIKLIPDRDIGSANKNETYNKFEPFYQYHFVCLLKELVYIFVLPIYLWYIYKNINEISHFIFASITYDDVTKRYSSKYANFRNYAGDGIHKKLESSLKSFIENHTNITSIEYDDLLNLTRTYESTVIDRLDMSELSIFGEDTV